MTDTLPNHKRLIRMVGVRGLAAVVLLGALFFLPAWTLDYWQAWAYLAILFTPMTFVLIYLFKKDPDLLARRMRSREKERAQRLVVRFSWITFPMLYLLPGFDHRLGWSNVSVPVVIVAEVLVVLGYGIFVLVLRANTYLSRTVEVDTGQKVISTGPYAVVRHPMYSGVILMYLATPVALGSWWALIPGLFTVPMLVARILNEEVVLERDLPGYTEYKQKTRYRLLPGVW